MTAITPKELSLFLVKAKKAAYASQGEANERVLSSGKKELAYCENDWKYCDQYKGFNPFEGKETVWKNGKPVWRMQYCGKTFSNSCEPKKAYSFLKKALFLVEADKPFRGPAQFKQNEFEYKNDSGESIRKFKGKEQIIFNGKKVYQLNYYGSLFKND